MHYLIRVEPFTSLHVQLQSGRCVPMGQADGMGQGRVEEGKRLVPPGILGLRLPAFLRPHLFPPCRPSPHLTLACAPAPTPALTALTGSSTQWQQPGRPAWRAPPM